MYSNITTKENNENEFNEHLFDVQDFYLIKENKVFKFIIGKRLDIIFIKSNNYEIELNINELTILTKSFFNNINDGYDFIINLFEEENKVDIKDIIIKKSIKLIFKIYIYNKEKEVEILLTYNKQMKNNNIINYNEIKDELNELKEEIKILKTEINELKILKNNNNIINNNNEKQNICINSNLSNELTQINNNNFTNPSNIHFLKYLTKDTYTTRIYDNAFSIFKSINNIFYLIYGNKNNSIICLNLINEQIIKEIKNAHNETITNFRHYLDKINSRDLLLSISINDDNIKIWNINNWECLLNLKKIYKW